MLRTCQAGYETLLARELSELHGCTKIEVSPGWVRCTCGPAASGALAHSPAERANVLRQLAFAHLSLYDAVERQGDSVNGLANELAAYFFEQIRGEQIEATWPNVWLGPAEVVGLGRRLSAVEAEFVGRLKRKLGRVAKLATPELPRTIGPARGLFVYFADFGRVFVAREAFLHGQRRMADDPLAPSRSYLKVEEAYLILEREPRPGETVCDLGAAPGGWSYSAAKHGARVIAVDNGPLKGGALDHPNIEHRREDAFKFVPAADQAPFDWLFCDLVEEPHHVLRDIIGPWLAHGWCRRFIVNLKFGRVDAVTLLHELRSMNSPLHLHAPDARIRHLFHNREELTVVGEVAS